MFSKNHIIMSLKSVCVPLTYSNSSFGETNFYPLRENVQFAEPFLSEYGRHRTQEN